MMSLSKYLTIIFISSVLFVTGCNQSNKKKTVSETQAPKELIVYCENAMLGLVLDLQEQFEEQYQCKIRIQNDCSQNLMDLISYTGKGDLYSLINSIF